MAFATQFTVTTGNKVSINFQSQQVEVSLTYQLEREDTDVLAVVREKTEEVAAAHRLAWEGVHGAKTQGVKTQGDRATITRKAKSPPSQDVEEAPAIEALGCSGAVLTIEPSPDSVALSEPELSVPTTPGQQAALSALLAHIGWSDEQTAEQLNAKFNVQSLSGLSCQQAASWLLELQRTEREKAAQRRLQTAQLNGKH